MTRKKKRLIQVILIMITLLSALSSGIALGQSYTKTQHLVSELQNRQNEDSQYYAKYNVLFISSYSPDFMTVPMQVGGLRSVFKKHQISLTEEFMQARLLHHDHYHDFYHHIALVLQAKKKAGVTIDAVVAGGDEALYFVKKYKDSLFKGMPICFMGVNDQNTAKQAIKDPRISGSIAIDPIQETLKLALKLQPHARNIVCLYDDTITGKQNMKNFYAETKDFEHQRLIGIDMGQYTLKQWRNRLSKLDAKRDIVLYMSAYEDKEGHSYTIPETIKNLNTYCHAPVYRTRDNGQGSGILGGVLYDTTYESQLAGKRIVDIIVHHKNISTMKLIHNNHKRVEFDQKVLNKYHLASSVLPKSAKILNKPESFQEMDYIFGFSLAIGVAMIVLLFFEENSYRAYEKSIAHLEYLNHHDDLTHLYSRNYAITSIKEACVKQSGTLVVVDIDNFAGINDTYGHDQGDLIIRQIGNRINAYSQKYPVVASRASGDEYMIYFPYQAKENEIKQLRYMICKDVKTSYDMLHMSVSMGIAFHQQGDDSKKLLMNADAALAQAKKEGKNKAVYYDESMRKSINEEEKIKECLVNALRKDGFEMLYQPKVDPVSESVIGYEALIRLKNREYPPNVFIGIAERNGLIIELSRLMTKLVIAQLSTWQKEGMKLYPVSINYSPAQIYDREYVAYLAELLEKYQLPSCYIRVEITESLMMEDRNATNRLFRDFNRLGILTLIDDFGTGYSSLSYLMNLPIPIVKIDKSFIDHYLKPGKEAFIEDMIKMLKDLKKLIVVEGVEEKWQKDQLKAYGVDAIQGYYYAKPLAPQAVIAFQNTHEKVE